MKKDMVRLAAIAGVMVVVAAGAAIYYTGAKKEERAQQVAKQPPAPSTTLVRPHSKSLGPTDAPVTIVEWLDPECESCRAMYPIVKHVMSQYPGKVRLVVRYMPFHGNSMYAAGALEAAGQQGKYWEMLESLFLNQPHWGSHHAPKPELIPDYARALGLDMQAWEQSVASRGHEKIVNQDRDDGKTLGVTGTPTFFVNGKMLDQLGYEPLKAAVDRELATR